MATYSPKLQGVDGVASASPSAAMEAERMRGEVVSSIFAAADKAYNDYKMDFVKEQAEEAAKLPEEFLDRNMKAQEAQSELSQLEQNPSGGFFALDKSGGSQKALDNYLTTAARLKAAADNGMSPDEYSERVAALTRKVIRQFPGMADTIRQQIGEASGLPGADRFAARRYVQETFGGSGRDKGGDKLGAKVLEDEVKTIAENSNVPITEVYKMVGTPEYDSLRKMAYEARSYGLAAKAAKDQADAKVGASSTENLTAIHAMGVGASLESAKDFTVFKGQNADLFKKLYTAVQSGQLDRADTTVAELDVLATQGTALIAKNFRMAEEQLLQKRALGTLSPQDYEAGKEILKRQRELAQENFDPKYIRNTAKILSAHKDKTLKDQLEIVRANVDFIKLFGSSELISAYYGGDDATRASIRQQSPSLADVLDKHLPVLKGMSGTVPDPISPMIYANVGDAIADGKESPDATPNKSLPPGASEEDRKQQRKARVDAVILEGAELLNKYRKQPQGLVTKQEANTLATALNNGMQYNAAVEKLDEGVETLTEIFQKIPAEDQEVVKASLAQQSAQAAEMVNKATQMADTKYGVKLQIGVRPNGSVGVIPPMDLFEDRKPVSAFSSIAVVPKVADIGVFSKYGELRYKQVKAGKEDEVARYAKAATEWESTQRRRANSMVLSEVVSTGGNKKTIGDKIARSLNKRVSIPPFFSALPTTATQTGAPLGEVDNVPRTQEGRLQGDIKALEAELSRIKVKPSWLSDAAWKAQTKTLTDELENLKKQVKQ